MGERYFLLSSPARIVVAGQAGADAVQTYIYPLLVGPEAIESYLTEPWALPPGE
jgi:hypothetical protein